MCPNFCTLVFKMPFPNTYCLPLLIIRYIMKAISLFQALIVRITITEYTYQELIMSFFRRICHQHKFMVKEWQIISLFFNQFKANKVSKPPKKIQKVTWQKQIDLNLNWETIWRYETSGSKTTKGVFLEELAKTRNGFGSERPKKNSLSPSGSAP